MQERLSDLRQNYRRMLRFQSRKVFLKQFRQGLLDKLELSIHTGPPSSKPSLLSFGELIPVVCSDDPTVQSSVSQILTKRFHETSKQLQDLQALNLLGNIIRHPFFKQDLITGQFVEKVIAQVLKLDFQKVERTALLVWILGQAYLAHQDQQTFEIIRDHKNQMVGDSPLEEYELFYLMAFKSSLTLRPAFLKVGSALRRMYHQCDHKQTQLSILQIICGYLLFSEQDQELEVLQFTLDIILYTLEGTFDQEVKSTCISITSYCVSVNSQRTQDQLLTNNLLDRILRYAKFGTHKLMVSSIQVLAIVCIYSEVEADMEQDVVEILVRALNYNNPVTVQLSLQALCKTFLADRGVVTKARSLGIQNKLLKLYNNQVGDTRKLIQVMIRNFFSDSLEEV